MKQLTITKKAINKAFESTQILTGDGFDESSRKIWAQDNFSRLTYCVRDYAIEKYDMTVWEISKRIFRQNNWRISKKDFLNELYQVFYKKRYKQIPMIPFEVKIYRNGKCNCLTL